MKILIRFLVIAAALGVAAWLVPGIVLTGHNHAAKVETLLIVAVIFGVINILLKPIIKTVGLRVLRAHAGSVRARGQRRCCCG